MCSSLIGHEADVLRTVTPKRMIDLQRHSAVWVEQLDENVDPLLLDHQLQCLIRIQIDGVLVGFSSGERPGDRYIRSQPPRRLGRRLARHILLGSAAVFDKVETSARPQARADSRSDERQDAHRAAEINHLLRTR